jgi:hypothetical protein
MELAAEQAEQQMKMKENQASTNAKQSLSNTSKQAQTGKSLDKKGKGSLKDAFNSLLREKSISEICRDWKIHDSTFRKIYDKIRREEY